MPSVNKTAESGLETADFIASSKEIAGSILRAIDSGNPNCSEAWPILKREIDSSLLGYVIKR